MKKNQRFKLRLTLLAVSSSLIYFQNCSGVNFRTLPPSPSVTSVCDPFDFDGEVEECNGTGPLVGQIYYFLNKSSSTSTPSHVFDVFDEAISFPDGINSVNMFFDRAFKVETTLLLNRIYVPVINFSNGFRDSQGNYLRDTNGNLLIEAFAFRVTGAFKLPADKPAGFYEFAILSDDGSIVSVDKNLSGQFQVLIDNDGTHSARLGCSADSISLSHDSELPIRIEYYQGPRSEIAVTLLARKVPDGPRELDPYCGHTSRTDWFGGEPNQAGYVPDPLNFRFGELIQRGWFVPETWSKNF